MSPMRSGKYFFTSGGSRMLPTPTAAKITRRREQQRDGVGREAAPGQADDDDDHRGEREPLQPEAALELRGQDAEDGVADRRRGADQADDRPAASAKSTEISAMTGESDATAERSENANRTMPTRARALPCQSGREGAEFTDPA